MKESDLPLTELETGPETVWNRVVFGHYWRDFDRDQYLTHWLARQAGFVGSDTDMSFEPYIALDYENDFKVLTIEGLRPDAKKNRRNYRLSRTQSLSNPGNWDNGPNGEPTAWMFWQTYRDEIVENSQYTEGQLEGLVKWFNRVEKGAKPSEADAGELNAHRGKLSQALHHVFYGAKTGYDSPQDARGFIDTMDEVIANGIS